MRDGEEEEERNGKEWEEIWMVIKRKRGTVRGFKF